MTSAPFLPLVFLAGCGPLASVQVDSGPAFDTGASPQDSEAPANPAEWEFMTAPMLQALASAEADQRWPGLAAVGLQILDDGSQAHMFGDLAAMQALLAGDGAGDGLAVVRVTEDGDCLAVFDDWGEIGGGDIGVEGAGSPCHQVRPDRRTLLAQSSELRIEAREDWRTEAPPPPPTCTSSCGSTEGYSYAGETAYSNGSTTGSGSSCSTTGTYGYRYQCVEFTERMAKRSDWAGNAYTGYWTRTGLSSTTQGPYYKGLLPLGSGTGYLAPQAGDVVVWSGGTYGHVGVLASVGSSTVTAYDQNRRCGDQRCTLTYGSSYTLGNGSGTGYCGSEGLSSYTVRGYLHRGWDFGGTYGLSSSSSTGATAHNWWPNDASYVGATTSSSVTDITDYITVNPGTSDPYLTSPAGLALPAYSSSSTHGYRYLSFYIQSNCTDKNAKMYWKRTSDSSFAESRSVTATISGTGWQTLTFNPSSSSSWSGTIDQVRLDPATSCSSGSTDTISLQSSWFWR